MQYCCFVISERFLKSFFLCKVNHPSPYYAAVDTPFIKDEIRIYYNISILYSGLILYVNYFYYLLRSDLSGKTSSKLKTNHKYFLCPYKRQISMICFIGIPIFRNNCVITMQVKERLYHTNYRYIMSTHYFACFAAFITIVVKVRLHVFYPYI